MGEPDLRRLIRQGRERRSIFVTFYPPPPTGAAEQFTRPTRQS